MTQNNEKLSPLALPKNKKPQRRKPLGKGIEWTDQDLDDLAEVSMADVKAADALWQAEAPAPLKKLLDAQVDSPARDKA